MEEADRYRYTMRREPFSSRAPSDGESERASEDVDPSFLALLLLRISYLSRVFTRSLSQRIFSFFSSTFEEKVGEGGGVDKHNFLGRTRGSFNI